MRLDAPPSLEAANQSQIDDLVRRNQTLEYTNKKLSEQISTEATRSEESVLEIRKQWHENQKQWREECDDLLACYRYIQLRTASEVETERVVALNEQKALRREKLLRLQRDFRITLFHARERALEERIAELEEEHEQLIVRKRTLAALLHKIFASLFTQLRLKNDQVQDFTTQRNEAEKDVDRLREANAHLQASVDSTSSRLERINLQLEGAQTARSELEGLNDDLKRKNHDLQRQLDKWQRLENKGDIELETLRKRKIELEIEVKELRDRLDASSEESTRALEKEKRRVEKITTTAKEWQEFSEMQQEEAKNAKKEIAQLQDKFEQLQAQQDRVAAATSSKATKPSVRDKKSAESEAPQLGKPPRRKRGTIPASDDDGIQEGSTSPAKAVKKRRKLSPVREVMDSGAESVGPLLPSETKARKPRKKRQEGIEGQVVEVSDDAARQKPQRKRKAIGDDSTSEKAKQSNSDRSHTLKPSKKAAAQNAGDSEDQEEREVPKKKKQKIRLFSDSQPEALNFGGGLNSGFDIPTRLSPVGESEGPIPSRAISGNVVSVLGGLIRNRMTGRTL